MNPGTSGKRLTLPPNTPRQSTPPSSSLLEKSICIPRQMPRNGRPDTAASRTGSSRPKEERFAIALPAAPTPGKTTRSAEATTAGSRVVTVSAPSAANAFLTLVRLPAP